MLVTRILPEQWPKVHRSVRHFVAKYKDKHITLETSAKLRALSKERLAQDGSIVLVASEGRHIVGVLVCRDFGHDFSLAVVRRGERSKGVGKELLRRAIDELGYFHVEIASDNVPSLKIAFGCGLRAYSVFVRDTGKVILRLKSMGQRERNN